MDVCRAPPPDAGVIRGVLSTIDCHTRVYAQSGYDALTGPQSVFPTALTLLLTIYVALIGYRLLFGLGGTRLTDAPLAALKIGFVLSLALNWNTFQTLVFDVTMKAPLQLAQTIGAPAAAGGAVLVSDPLGGLQVTYDELARSASALGKLAGPNPQVLRGGEAAAADTGAAPGPVRRRVWASCSARERTIVSLVRAPPRRSDVSRAFRRLANWKPPAITAAPTVSAT